MEPQLNQYGNAQSIAISAGELAEIRQLQHEVKALRALNRLALELHSITSELSVYQRVVQLVSEALEFSDCGLFVPSTSDPQLLQRVAACGLRACDKAVPQFQLNDSAGLVALAARQHQTIYVADTAAEPRYLAGQLQYGSELVVPVMSDGKLLAVLDCEHPSKHFFADNQSLLEQVAEVLARKLEQLQGLANIQWLSWNTLAGYRKCCLISLLCSMTATHLRSFINSYTTTSIH